MSVVYDPGRRVTTPVLACRSCGKPLYFSLTVGGKRAPFDIDDQGAPTRTLHFITCSDPRRWSNKRVRNA